MKHLQTFNESIIEDKIRYLKDICTDFFDDYDGFEFEIINGLRYHSNRRYLPVGGWDRRPLTSSDIFGNIYSTVKYPDNYIFLYIRNSNVKKELNSSDKINYLNDVFDKFDKHLISINFRSSGYSGYIDGSRLYRFEKHSKRTQKYI